VQIEVSEIYSFKAALLKTCMRTWFYMHRLWRQSQLLYKPQLLAPLKGQVLLQFAGALSKVAFRAFYDAVNFAGQVFVYWFDFMGLKGAIDLASGAVGH